MIKNKNMNKFAILLVILAVSYSTEARQSRALQNFYCNDPINSQIKMELDASHTYLSLANHFSSDLVALEGFAKMFEHSWKEEVEHAEKLINYVHKRGGNVVTPAVSVIRIKLKKCL